MIKVVKGDLLDATENIIGHQVNCQGKMGSGIAKQIKNKYYTAYISYSNICYQKEPQELLGRCDIVHVGENKFVANIFGQLNYGYDGKLYTDYGALRESLNKLKVTAQRNILSVALPYKIGSDRGGADWNEVYQIIDEVFYDYEVTLYKLCRED